jgi:pimeloyl-ACP methyl ester carboxylesterase
MAAPRFLFVHGAWHGAWSFDLLRLELERRAVGCEAVDLPGLGDDATAPPEATFESGVDRLLERLGTRRNWTVVAHSFGAFAATETALRASGRVRALVIVAGFVPQSGDDWAAATSIAPVAPAFLACQRKDAAGAALDLDVKEAAPLLWHDVAPGIAAAAAVRIRAQPIEPFKSAKIGGTAEALRKIPRSLLLATKDRVLLPAGLRAMAERAGVAVEEVATGHCPFLSAPKLVADRLLGVK